MKAILLVVVVLSGALSGCDYSPPGCYRYFYYPEDEHGFRYDPQERDPKHAVAFAATKLEVERECAEYLGHLGAFQCTFPVEKRILKERHSIDWKTPEELNPCAIID